MATTQYTGARYVPLFADPIDWSRDLAYGPLTIVTHEGNSYTSRQFVPKGINITNEHFWALTGNYNAQIEQYRKEVSGLSTDVVALATRVDNISRHFVSPEQFGAKGDGATNDLLAFQTLSKAVKNNNNLTIVLKPGATYYVDFPEDPANFIALDLYGINTLDVIGNGATVHVASNVNTKYFINIRACENVHIHDFTVYSEFNKYSAAFGDHSRENAVGSNINPIVITNDNVRNVAVYNMAFKYTNVCIDCISLPAVSAFSTGLYVSNCTSDYHAIFVFTNKYNNVVVTNCTLRGAMKYGDGDHSFYFRGPIDRVLISDIVSDNDSYFGPDILFYPEKTGDIYNTIVNISNYHCTGNAFISAYTGGKINVDGFTFIQADESTHQSTTNYPVFGLRSATEINAVNGTVLNKNIAYGTKGKLCMSNTCVINSNYPVITLPKNAEITVTNSALRGRAIILSSETGAPSSSVAINGCSVSLSENAANYAIAVRADNIAVEFNNNSVDLGKSIYLFSNQGSQAKCTVKFNDVVNSDNNAALGSLSSASTQYGNYLNGKLS